MNIRETIHTLIKDVSHTEEFDLTVPEKSAFGHYATNVALQIAGREGENPREVAENIKKKLESNAPSGFFDRIEIAGPGFINFFLSPSSVQEAFTSVSQSSDYGTLSLGTGKTVIVEYSQPNIAKQTHIGHIRTTVIGDALAAIHEAAGYSVIRWNYLGDWGTQFGKVIAAYKRWGSKEDVEKNPMETLESLYVRFHREAETDLSLEDAGQEEFRKLEAGDKENRELWEWFRKESIAELESVYELLGISFDLYLGEAFFEDKMTPLVEELLEKSIAEESEGALIVPLEKENLPPALVRKSDGASLYLTRDIAALRYRVEEYDPAKILYVVGNEQTLHFQQLFAVAKKLGLLKSHNAVHVKYGLMLAEGGTKMSSRKGTSLHLKELLTRVTEAARDIVREKNPDLTEQEQEEVACVVGVGALKYSDLKEHRHSDITFDWKRMLDLKGDTAPYLQYSYARLRSILRKAEVEEGGDTSLLGQEEELVLMRKLFEFPEEIAQSTETLLTSNLAKYLHELAVLANRFYESVPVLKEENEDSLRARLTLIRTTTDILRKGLGLLGVQVLERM